jgi:hypothetical protein
MTNRLLDGFNDSLLKTFDIMRISKRQKLVGSASITGNIITNDYDLNEIFEENSQNDMDILTKLYLMFLWKFKTIHKSKNLWITDFKCGEYNDDPIRWTMKDMERGYKNIGSVRLFFTNCLTQTNTVTKLDTVMLLNNRFVEISEIYYIKVNGLSNFNTDDFKIGKVINSLRDDIDELIMDKNYFKALKREYRILDLLQKQPRRRELLTDLFNGQYGYLYYAISQLKTLVLMKDQKFRAIPEPIFEVVQQSIKDDIGKIVNYRYSITGLNDPNVSVKSINVMINFLNTYLNKYIEKYIK